MTIKTTDEINSIWDRLKADKGKYPEIDDFYKKKHEGDVFCHVMANSGFESISISKRYFTLKNGIVYEIYDGKLLKTEDSIFTLQRQCIRVGKYNPKFTYQQKNITMPYGEFLKRNKLK